MARRLTPRLRFCALICASPWTRSEAGLDSLAEAERKHSAPASEPMGAQAGAERKQDWTRKQKQSGSNSRSKSNGSRRRNGTSEAKAMAVGVEDW